ncbi:MAG TPA: peptide chain release factor N(5)-glutamine methyltransferase [Vicinamibacterales bacterium]|nr:peptide chain release factor N(5)-glutamine methyltransferase [Vicinamibacterales bacterium]
MEPALPSRVTDPEAQSSGPTLQHLVQSAAARLERAGLSPADAAFDAGLLARAVLGWDRATLLVRAPAPPPPGFEEKYEALVARRERREPAAQLLGYREFWGRPFEVTRDVLVPRPETELIVESALERLRQHAPDSPRIVDVGTGSGCLAITLALEAGLPVTATDISEAALQVARRNAIRLGAPQVTFVRAHLLEGLAPGFDLIVANPPYVRETDRQALSPEVRDYEPETALFGGEDGLAIVRELLDVAPRYLRPHGHLLMEFGAGQDDVIRSLVAARPQLRLEAIREDLQGIDRMAIIRCRNQGQAGAIGF